MQQPPGRVDAPVIRYLSKDEIRRLLEACEGAFRDLVHAALLTGCRYGELCRLKVADYNADVETLSIRTSKNGQARHVTVTGEAPELFERLLVGHSLGEFIFKREDGRAWKRAEQVRPMRDACKRAGIVPAVSFHVLRHTHASILAMRAVPMVARQLGHAAYDRTPLRAPRAELRRGHDPGEFFEANGIRWGSCAYCQRS